MKRNRFRIVARTRTQVRICVRGQARARAWTLALAIGLSALLLSACAKTKTLEATSVPPSGCPGSYASPTSGDFGVELLGGGANPVCARNSSGAEWGEMGSNGSANYGYEVGTFLNREAQVGFSSAGGYASMYEDTHVQLPGSAGGTMYLVGGRIFVKLYSSEKSKVGRVCISGSATCVDPDYAVYEFGYNPDTKTADVQVYAGQVTVGAPGKMVNVLVAWQRLTIGEGQGAAPRITAVTEPPSPKAHDLLQKEGLPTQSPLQPSGATLPRDPALDPVAPIFASDWGSQQVYLKLMEGLFRFDGGGFVPAGAVKIESSADGMQHVVTLRRDALWSDGKPVIAQNYVAGICRVANPEIKLEEASQLYFIKGLEQYHTGQIPCQEIALEPIDEFTLRISTTMPVKDLASALATPLAFPARTDVLDECGRKWTEPGCFVVNGPYVLESWAHNKSLLLVQNKRYWNASAVAPDRLEFKIGQ